MLAKRESYIYMHVLQSHPIRRRWHICRVAYINIKRSKAKRKLANPPSWRIYRLTLPAKGPRQLWRPHYAYHCHTCRYLGSPDPVAREYSLMAISSSLDYWNSTSLTHFTACVDNSPPPLRRAAKRALGLNGGPR